MVVVQAVHFREDGVPSGYEMTLDDFGDFLELGDDFGVAGGLRQGDADVGAHIEAEGLRFHQQPGSGDHSVRFQTLDPLMDGGAGDAAFTGDLQEGHPGVLDKEGQDFLVDLVDVIGSSHRTGRLLFQTNRYKIKKFFYKLFIFGVENLRFNKKTASKTPFLMSNRRLRGLCFIF